MTDATLVHELDVSGKKLRVLELRGEVRVSRPFRFEVTAAAETKPVPAVADLLGKDFKLVLRSRYGDSAKLVVKGVVSSVERSVLERGSSYRLELVAKLEVLALGQDSRVFQKLSVVDIVKAVLAAGDVTDVDWKVTGAHAKRDYVAQYRESDLAFVERLCADEGIYYYFDFADDVTKVVFADDSTAAGEIVGGASIVNGDGSNLISDKDWVEDLAPVSSIVSDAVRLRDYDLTKPKLKLDEKAVDGSGAFELYDFPGHFRTPADGKARAKLLLEGARSLRGRTRGRSDGLRVRPGAIFDPTGHPVSSLDGRSFCIAAAYELRGGDGDASWAQDWIEATWEAIPATTPFRPPSVEPVRQSGIQTGIVVGASGQEIHTDDAGTVRVQLYWDRTGKKDDTASTPMRVGQVPLVGSMILPRVGWEMIVEHHEGDVDAPVVMGHLYDGKNVVPYALPANKTRSAWQTATTPADGTSNEIRFEDSAGSEEMFINASKDMTVTVGDNCQSMVGANHTHKIGAKHDVTVGADCTLGVKSNQEASIAASETRTVSGNRSSNVGGAETTSIGGSRSVTATMGHKIDADGGRSVTIGGSMMAVASLGVSRASLGTMNVSVSGAWISAAATGLANTTVGAGSETVGGVKLQAGAAGVELKVKGVLAETVGGAYVSTTGGKCGESSQANLTFLVGGAFLATSPKIEIEADSEITITCGASSITINSSSIEVKSPSLASPGATVSKDGSTISQNP